ncbi:MAG: hypothetical protein ACYS8W_20930 [Planctomycetota bacterium]|jgi:type II secretory pathway component GspD/PulD (secretin)
MRSHIRWIPLVCVTLFVCLAAAMAGEKKRNKVEFKAREKAALQELIEYFGELTGLPVITHSSASSSKTIVFPTDIVLDSDKIEYLLELNGYTLVYVENKSGDYYELYDQRNLRPLRVGPARMLKDDEPIPEKNMLVTKVVEVRHVNSLEIERALNTRIIDRAGADSVLGVRDSSKLILRGLAQNISYYVQLIKEMDAPPRKVEAETRMVQLKHMEAYDVEKILDKAIKKERASSNIFHSTHVEIFPDEVNNRILIAASGDKIDYYEKLVKELDREKSEEAPVTRIYRIKHADPAILAAKLQEFVRKVKDSGYSKYTEISAAKEFNAVIVYARQKVQKELAELIGEFDGITAPEPEKQK